MQKINFNERFGLETAVLKNIKECTRRIEKASNEYKSWLELGFKATGRYIINKGVELQRSANNEYIYLKTRYQIGEIVAIAQCYDKVYRETDFELTANGRDFIHDELDKMMSTDKPQAGWTNKLFVRAELMPHHIEITDVRIERLQDISEDDCLKEGIVKTNCVAPYGFPIGNGKWKNFRTPKDAFFNLITNICGSKVWNDNSYIVRYGFKLLK